MRGPQTEALIKITIRAIDPEGLNSLTVPAGEDVPPLQVVMEELVIVDLSQVFRHGIDHLLTQV